MTSGAPASTPAAGPRALRVAIVGMVVLALASAVWVRLAGGGGVAPLVPLSEARSLLFRDAADGSVLVFDATDDRLVRRYAAGSGGFTRGMMRGLSRQRSARGISLGLPFVIGWREDRRLILRDPSTRTDIVLDAFGMSNRSVFEALLEKSPALTGNQSRAARQARPDRRLQLAGESRS